MFLVKLPINKSFIDQSAFSAICLPISHMCDGEYNLNNWEDEQNCDNWTCAVGYRKCDSNLQCVPERKFCDWIYDCPDYSDDTGTLQLFYFNSNLMCQQFDI